MTDAELIERTIAYLNILSQQYKTVRDLVSVWQERLDKLTKDNGGD